MVPVLVNFAMPRPVCKDNDQEMRGRGPVACVAAATQVLLPMRRAVSPHWRYGKASCSLVLYP